MSNNEMINQTNREAKEKPLEISEMLELILSGVERLSEQVVELQSENKRHRELEMTQTMGNAANMQATIDNQYKHKY